MSSIAPPKPAIAHAAFASAALPTQKGARVALALLFGIYLTLLGWAVLWKLEVPWIGHASARTVKLIPYVTTGTAGANSTTEIALNAALFIPFGVYLRHFAPTWSGVRILGLIAGTSILFEAIQYALAVGASDVADVINNSLGGLIGVWLYAIAKRRFRAGTEIVLLRSMLVGTAGALLIATAYVLVTWALFGGPLTHLPPPPL